MATTATKIDGIEHMADAVAIWRKAKADEAEIVARRREVEDWIVEAVGMADDFAGSMSMECGDVKVKLTRNLTKKVDVDKLRQIAEKTGLNVDSLFRWKAEVDSAAWKKSAPEIISAVEPAITTSAGRPTFTMTI